MSFVLCFQGAPVMIGIGIPLVGTLNSPGNTPSCARKLRHKNLCYTSSTAPLSTPINPYHPTSRSADMNAVQICLQTKPQTCQRMSADVSSVARTWDDMMDRLPSDLHQLLRSLFGSIRLAMRRKLCRKPSATPLETMISAIFSLSWQVAKGVRV